MVCDVLIRISLKNGMLNPEATQIEKSLELLGYDVENVNTEEVITFQMEGNNILAVSDKVNDMCERLLCNPVIHDYEVKVRHWNTPSD